MACILIIDDDDSVRTMLCLLLEHLGHEVIEAVDGMSGVSRFGTRPFDLVFTDLVMPGKAGREVIGDIRRLAPAIGIVAMSGGNVGAPEAGLGFAREVGADHMLPKPFSVVTLQTILADLLGKRRESPPAD